MYLARLQGSFVSLIFESLGDISSSTAKTIGHHSGRRIGVLLLTPQDSYSKDVPFTCGMECHRYVYTALHVSPGVDWVN